MKVTALLTGRGNNTLKDKNILDILGKPVLYYPAHAAACSKLVTDKYCSSDDEKILAAAGEERRCVIFRVGNIAFLQHLIDIFLDTVCKLTLKLRHKCVHGGKLIQVLARQTLTVFVKTFALAQYIFQKARGIKSAVAPRRLHSGDEVFDASDHRVVEDILFGIAESAQCRHIDGIVHQSRVSESRADDL